MSRDRETQESKERLRPLVLDSGHGQDLVVLEAFATLTRSSHNKKPTPRFRV